MIASSCRKLFAAGILVAFACVPMEAVAQSAQSSSSLADSVSIDTVLLGKDVAARMTIPVNVGSNGPYHFIVDTGAERTVISSELADFLKLDRRETVQVDSMSGRGPASSVMIPNLTIDDIAIDPIHAPTLAQANLGASGILGLDGLRSRKLIFDFDRRTIAFSRGLSPRDRSNPDTVTIRATNGFGRMVLGNTWINGLAVTVILDTGTQISIGNEALRQAILSGRASRRKMDTVQMISVLGDRIAIDYTRVDSVTIGDVFIQDMPVAFADIHTFSKFNLLGQPALLLGMDVMRLFSRVSIDFENRIVHFVPRGKRGGDTSIRFM